MSDDLSDEEPDPVLRLFGSSVVGRIRSGEVGVLLSIESQNNVLDALSKAKDSTAIQAIKQIFEETKVPRARAHKLERLLNEHISSLEHGPGSGSIEAKDEDLMAAKAVPPGKGVRPVATLIESKKKDTPSDTASTEVDVPPRAPVDEVEHVEEPLPIATIKTSMDVQREAVKREPLQSTVAKRAQEEIVSGSTPHSENVEHDDDDLPSDFVLLQDPLEYRLADRLVQLKATVRLRSQPESNAPAIGLVTSDSTLLIDGLTQNWFRVVEPVKAWALRAAPDGQLLFQRKLKEAASNSSSQVSIEEFEAVLDRLNRLERDFDALRNTLRNI